MKHPEDYTALDVACPYCQVAVGTHCTTMNRTGYLALKGNRSHQARVGLAADIARAARARKTPSREAP